MRTSIGILVLILALGAVPIVAQQTPAPVVQAYDSLADTILSLRQAELDFVRSVLDGHLHAATVLRGQGDWQGTAAQMALFANEGDNAIGGVRKSLLEGGHHFNAAGEEQGIFEPGYVVVTKEAKKKMLAAASALRSAETDAAREAAWSDFETVAKGLLDAR